MATEEDVRQFARFEQMTDPVFPVALAENP
jgi:hypothetical protein